ncbi:MAG: ABC transporter permease [Myxococcaceae bacterium]|nr:ABC transporter permease [Myxococcaceae bacterium]
MIALGLRGEPAAVEPTVGGRLRELVVGVVLLACGAGVSVVTFSLSVATGAGFVLAPVGLIASGFGFLMRSVWVAARAPAGPSSVIVHPRIAKYRDFHWGTLAEYGFGMLLAELALIVIYTFLIGLGAGSKLQLDDAARVFTPVTAFLVAMTAGGLIAFAGGYLGSANSKRLSIPEATLAMLYFGIPVPVLLTLMHGVPALSVRLGYRLREITYLSSLLGEARPQLGYWLVFVFLALMGLFGMCAGFVATSSGRTDVRSGFELFVANRHVSAFRPRLLLGALAVLWFGIVPPLLVYAVIMATERQVERTRIKHLGLRDPLLAARALNDLKGRQLGPIQMMTALSVGAVGLGVMSIIIVLSVMSGFEQDLQQKILGTNSHGVVLKYSDSMAEYEKVMEKIATVKGVAGQTPFILGEVMISSEGNISGSMIKGIDPETVGTVTDLPSYLLPPAKLQWLDDPSLIQKRHLKGFDDKPDIERDEFIKVDKDDEDGDGPVMAGIFLGRELASSLKVVVGDRVNVVSPLGGEMGPQGPMPKSRPFRVAGIFYSGMFEYDSKFVYIHLRDAQTFFNIKGASGVELKMEDIDDARRVTRAIYDKLEGYPYRTKDWGEMNRNLFAALRLEKLVMGIILSIIVIVAAGLIVATVIMLVLEKRKEIAVLKALGVSDGGIVKIFLSEGLQIGVAGGILGLIAGLAWCFFIERVGIKLDPQVYYIPALPVRIEPLQTALAVVIAILVTFLASIYPALKASQVEPVEGLKAE